MIRRLWHTLHFLVSLPFPRYHHAHFHAMRMEARDGSLWLVCNHCDRATPVNLDVTIEEIRARRVF